MYDIVSSQLLRPFDIFCSNTLALSGPTFAAMAASCSPSEGAAPKLC